MFFDLLIDQMQFLAFICFIKLSFTSHRPVVHLYPQLMIDVDYCYIKYHYYTSSSSSDWSRAFNPFAIACELDMINAISAADIADIVYVKFNVCLVTKPLGLFSETNG